MWALAQRTVDENSPYAYLMVAEFFADTSAVADDGNAPVGMVTGFRLPDDPETLFIWQIAVAEGHRGRGLGRMLLDDVVNRPTQPRITHLVASVTPDNGSSDRLFRSFAERWNTGCIVEELFAEDDFPDGDHDAELRYRIGPL